MSEFVRKIESTLKTKNLTRKAFAKFAGLSEYTLKHLLEGETKYPKKETINKINNAINTIKESSSINDNHSEKQSSAKIIISFETIAEAECDIVETQINKNITQREYRNIKIIKVIEQNKDDYKIIRSLGECAQIATAMCKASRKSGKLRAIINAQIATAMCKASRKSGKLRAIINVQITTAMCKASRKSSKLRAIVNIYVTTASNYPAKSSYISFRQIQFIINAIVNPIWDYFCSHNSYSFCKYYFLIKPNR
jgi:transcriptional regulator with XRE-family HTH domain